MPHYSRKTISIFFFVKQLFMTFAIFCIELYMSFFSVSCHFSTKAVPKLQLFTVAMNCLSVRLICNFVFLSLCLFAYILLMHMAHSNLKISTDIHKEQKSGFRRWVIWFLKEPPKYSNKKTHGVSVHICVLNVLISQKFREEWCRSEAASTVWKKEGEKLNSGCKLPLHRCKNLWCAGAQEAQYSPRLCIALPATERLNVFSMKK